MKKTMLVVSVLALGGAPAYAQAVPEGSQATRLAEGYRRSPLFGVDPFRNVMLPRWGIATSIGAFGANNAFSLQDGGAVSLLSDEPDGLGIGDVLDIISLIPVGEGFNAAAEGEGTAYLGMSFGRKLTLGFSAGTRAYGSLVADDQIVSFFRDGNVNNQSFSFGASSGLALVTADAGAHAVVRFGPLSSIDGVQVSAGFGARMVRPLFMVDARSSVTGGGTFSLGTDSIRGNVGMEIFSSFPLDSTDNAWPYIKDRLSGNVGSGASMLGDLLLRLEWPTSGIALEGMVINLGSGINVASVGHGSDTLSIQTTSLDSLRSAVDSLDFSIRDSMDVVVALPRIWRVSASTWANAILQLDVSASGSLAGDIEIPTSVTLGSTWRFARVLPIRAGMILGGSQGIGFAGGFGIESRNFLLRFSGQSLGGLFQKATGVGGRVDFGLFF